MKEEKRRNKLMALMAVYDGQRSSAFKLRALAEQRNFGVSPKTRNIRKKKN